VPAQEKDYSDYIQYMSSFNSVSSVFAGFIFTILTLLLTLLPDPSSIMAQITFFFLAVLFDLLVFLIAWNLINTVYFCREVPPLTKRLAIFNWVAMLGFDLTGIAVILVFLLSTLIYLALASTVVWTIVIIANFIFVWKPLREFRKTRASILERNAEKGKDRDIQFM